MKWNESSFRPPLCTYRLNWARRTSWGWWDDWDDTVLQTQDSKFEPWGSEAEHATSRSRRLPTILTFTRGWGRNIFCFFETAETGNRTPNSGVKGSGANHYPRAPAQFRWYSFRCNIQSNKKENSTHKRQLYASAITWGLCRPTFISSPPPLWQCRTTFFTPPPLWPRNLWDTWCWVSSYGSQVIIWK